MNSSIDLFTSYDIRLVDMDDDTLKKYAGEAFERLADTSKNRKVLADWFVLGTHMASGQESCKESGGSYPQWCIDNGYDYRKFGSKGKGLIYSVPRLVLEPEILELVMKEYPNLNNPEHIVYQYNKIKKELRKLELADEREQMAIAGMEVPLSERWRVFNDDLANWKSDKQYDFIITDPPYPKEFLPLFGTLMQRSKEWLAPGGLMVIMSGQAYFDQVMAQLTDYYWIGAYLTPGQPTPLRQVNVNTTWKPLIFCSPNGDYEGKIFGDVFKSEGNDKEHHKWGQSESGMYDIVSKLCLPGQSILDPFMGAGTTGVAALQHGCLFDGVELLEENCNISKVRLSQTTEKEIEE